MKKENWQPQAKIEKQQAIAIPDISLLSLKQNNQSRITVPGLSHLSIEELSNVTGGGVGVGGTGPATWQVVV